MNIKIENFNLSLFEKSRIENLLERESTTIQNDLEQMWYLMDLIWDEYECDNNKLDFEKISQFYSHPVWLLNGLFAEQHEESMMHRNAISSWIANNDFEKIVDYGGGFGTLARLIAQKDTNVEVNIYEPHPSEFGLQRAREFNNIKIVGELGTNYDCVISIDVLEHISTPLINLFEMIQSLKMNGYLIIANAFYPQIKCHLPCTFHLRYTFNIFTFMFGLKNMGQLEGSHAKIYQKVKNKSFHSLRIQILEFISKSLYPILNFLHPYIKKIIGKK